MAPRSFSVDAPAAAPIGDAEWVRRAKLGDRAAEEALYRAHVVKVTRAVTRLLGSGADADDVVQDTFVRALENLSGLSDGALFGAWVRRIAITLCLRRFRRRRLLRSLGLDRKHEPSLEGVAAPTMSADRRLELKAVDVALGALRAEARSAWILHYVEGWTLQETADALEVSVATAKRRLAEANDAVTRATGRGEMP